MDDSDDVIDILLSHGRAGESGGQKFRLSFLDLIRRVDRQYRWSWYRNLS